MKVLHIITGLQTGGAEMMLAKLVSSPCLTTSTVAVVSLIRRGPIADLIEAQGIPVYGLGMTSGIGGGAAVWRLRRVVRALRPELIQGWMYHGNLGALAARAFLPTWVPVAWNVRQSLYDIVHEKALTRHVIRWNARLSANAQAIIYNARISASQHQAIGFDPQRAVILPNGFDLRRFQPEPEVRNAVRAELGYRSDIPVVGMFARFHPMKDHHTFLEAARLVIAQRPELQVLMIGRGIDADNDSLRQQCDALGLSAHVRLLGERADVSRFMKAVDVCVLSSAWGEAFPNVLGEAMACGIPCVATSIGSSAEIIGDTGVVVPPRDPQALADGMLSVIAGPARALGERARLRIVDQFAIEGVAQRYADLYRSLRENHGCDAV
ncbi:MAG: glycosyltransferase [Acidiferrobacter sp.]